MLVFPSMLITAALAAGIKVPSEDFDEENLDSIKEDYPHFVVFCHLQLNRRMSPGEHWENAKIIAKIPEKDLKAMMLEDFLKLGLHYST